MTKPARVTTHTVIQVGVTIATVALLCYLVATVVAGFFYGPMLDSIASGFARAGRIHRMEFTLDDGSSRRVTECLVLPGEGPRVSRDDHWSCSVHQERDDSTGQAFLLGLIDTLSMRWRSGCPVSRQRQQIIAVAFVDTVPTGARRRLFEDALSRCNGSQQ
jgi:hypothetical protein